MQEAAVQEPNPQTTITIPQQTTRLEPGLSAEAFAKAGPGSWQRIRDDFLLDELPHSVLVGDQKSAGGVLIQRLQRTDRRDRHRVVFPSTWSQSPQPGLRRCPESATRILVQRSYPRAKTVGIALCAAVFDRAQRPNSTPHQTDPACVSAGPYRSFTILD